MSIYDTPFLDDEVSASPAKDLSNQETREIDIRSQPNTVETTPTPAPTETQSKQAEKKRKKKEQATPVRNNGNQEESTPRRKTGCLTRLMVLGLLAFLGVAVVVGYGFLTWTSHARRALETRLADSDLSPEDQEAILGHADRVLDGYDAGEISLGQLAGIFSELSESSLFPLLMAHSAREVYILPSGLSEEEKFEATYQLNRIARGMAEGYFEPEMLSEIDDVISIQEGDRRQLKPQSEVSDDELRKMVATCKTLSDELGVPDEHYFVNIGAEVGTAVERGLLRGMN